MTDIAKLPNKWRQANRILSCQKGMDDCADQLESALPKWTKITDNPETWPDDGQACVLYEKNGSEPFTFKCNHDYFEHGPGCYLGDWWRPLCRIDYPPKAEVSGMFQNGNNHFDNGISQNNDKAYCGSDAGNDETQVEEG